MPREKQAYTVHTVDKAFDILDALAESTSDLPITELAGRTGLNRNKTFRLLSTLCDRGLAERDPFSGLYRLGVCSVALAQRVLMHASLVNYAHPVMEQLARKHDEAVYLTVIRDDEVVFLDMVDCNQNIKAAPLVGMKFPTFTNAAGKVMRALDSRDLLEKLFKNRGKKQRLDLDALSSELDEIRTRGVAVDCGALGEGVISVAVAVKDYGGKVIAALTMLGPAFRMLTERLENEIIPSMLEGAEILSEKFGYVHA